MKPALRHDLSSAPIWVAMAGAILLTVMDAIMKGLSDRFATIDLVAGRYVFGVVWSVPLAFVVRGQAALGRIGDRPVALACGLQTVADRRRNPPDQSVMQLGRQFAPACRTQFVRDPSPTFCRKQRRRRRCHDAVGHPCQPYQQARLVGFGHFDRQRCSDQVVADAGKTAGAPVALKGFVRYALGEGIEKTEGLDFAAEVASMAR